MTGYEDAFRENRREARDCAVVSLAMVTGVSYVHAHGAMETVGRGGQRSTPRNVTKDALAYLGWEVRREWTKADLALELRAEKPTLADLEGKDWLPRMLVFVNRNDHVAPFYNGHVRDWSADTEAVIDLAWELAKTGLESYRYRRAPPVIYL